MQIIKRIFMVLGIVCSVQTIRVVRNVNTGNTAVASVIDLFPGLRNYFYQKELHDMTDGQVAQYGDMMGHSLVEQGLALERDGKFYFINEAAFYSFLHMVGTPDSMVEQIRVSLGGESSFADEAAWEGFIQPPMAH